VWCALDFETWTENHSIVTEFGFSAVHWTEDEQKTDTGHFTVEEHRFHRNGRTYPNGKHVPEYREVSIVLSFEKYSETGTDT
jgi:hypothetical protein